MDADGRPTGSPLLDFIAARGGRLAAQSRPSEGEPEQPIAPKPEPEPEADPGLPAHLRERPLAVAARLRRERAAAGVEAGVMVIANGAPGRLHALHRRKTRWTATTERTE